MTRWTIVSAAAFLAAAAQGCSCSGDSGVDAGGMNEAGEILGEGQDDGDADATDGAEGDGTTCTADTDCDDGLFCTADTCGAGVCNHAALGCDDGIPCTTDSCDESGDSCAHATMDMTCDDGLFCNGAEYCEAGFGCRSGALPDCSDGYACTVETCDEALHCVRVPDSIVCDDGFACNGVEGCDPPASTTADGCVPGTPIVCSDGASCTTDTCVEPTGGCAFADNGGCGPGAFCDPALANCGSLCCPGVLCGTDADCDDGLFCNGAESCVLVGGILRCSPGAPPSCDDGLTCTADSCSESSRSCVHTPNDAFCSDGLPCNGTEACDPMRGAPPTGCITSGPVVCDDGIGCTTEVCDDAIGACVYLPSNAACSDGVFCNGPERCSTATGCSPGAPPTCDDGIACTADGCDAPTDSCVHAPDGVGCQNGLGCDGSEACDPLAGCVPGAPFDCADAVACTLDACVEGPPPTCQHTPDHTACGPGQVCSVTAGCIPGMTCTLPSSCQDGNACNGVEACAGGVCQGGTPPSCDDFVACTIDACTSIDSTTFVCTNTAADQDGDGYGSASCGGSDCCDACGDLGCPAVCDSSVPPTLHPGAPEPNCSAVDFNCDGAQTGGRAGDVCAVPSDCCQNSCIVGFCCVVTPCSGHVLQCNDCIDNDGDGLIDSRDPECLGPCDNTEVPNLNADVGGETGGPCQSDCYFDFGNGSGNDNCFWDHRCDPLEVAPNYYPEGPSCEYDPGRVGTRNCPLTQSATCLGFCLPITPNGCDCFGCCTFPALAGTGPGGTDGFVWIQHLDGSGTGTCTLAAVTDPAACPPCTPVPDCLNPCEACELCVGRPTLPPGCIPGDRCEPGVQPCGQPGDADCSADFYCITGCCQLAP